MKSLIQELRIIPNTPVATNAKGYVVEIWVPTKNGGKLERLAKQRRWWLYGRRRAGKGLAFFIRVESKWQAKAIENELAMLAGEWRGKPGSNLKRKAQRRILIPRQVA